MTPDQDERNREERIRRRALEIWREQGCPDGRAKEHWEQAEREVDSGDGSEAGGDQQPTSQSVSDETATSPEAVSPLVQSESSTPGRP
jgi:hypothetical protein